MDAGEQARPRGLQHIVGAGGSQPEAASDAAQWPLEAPDHAASSPAAAARASSASSACCAAIAAAWRWRGHAGAAPADRRFPQKDSDLPCPLRRPRTQPSTPSPPEGALPRTRSRRHLARCRGRRRRRVATAKRTAPDRRRRRPARRDPVGDLLTPARHVAENACIRTTASARASPPGMLALDEGEKSRSRLRHACFPKRLRVSELATHSLSRPLPAASTKRPAVS
jgi:hypothetical protein